MVAAAAPILPALEAVELTRRFGRRSAVAGVDLALHRGECLAVFGPNGAGKTTLLRLLAGLLRPTSGVARVAGVGFRGGSGPAARARVGLVSHQTMLYPALTARENVEFAARLYRVPDPREAVDRALAAMRLADRRDAPVRLLSRGMQQRVSIARSMVHDPTAVLLDEPYTGLDAAGAAALTDMLHRLRFAGAALVVVTHNVPEGLDLATRVAIMSSGRFARVDERSAVDAPSYAAEYKEFVTHGA